MVSVAAGTSPTKYSTPSTVHVRAAPTGASVGPDEGVTHHLAAPGLGGQASPHLLLDPRVRALEPDLQGDLRLPVEHLAEAGVVGVAPAHTLGAVDEHLHDLEPGDLGHHVGEVGDRDQPVLADVERFGVVRPHQPDETGDAVVDVAEGPRLPAVSPDLDPVVARVLRDRDLAAHGRRRLLAAALPRPQRAEDVVEAD